MIISRTCSICTIVTDDLCLPFYSFCTGPHGHVKLSYTLPTRIFNCLNHKNTVPREQAHFKITTISTDSVLWEKTSNSYSFLYANKTRNRPIHSKFAPDSKIRNHIPNKLTCRLKKRSADKFDSSDPSYCQFLIKL